MSRAVRVALDTWKKSFGARRGGPGPAPDALLWRIETLEPKLLLSADAIPAVHLVVGDSQDAASVYRFHRNDGAEQIQSYLDGRSSQTSWLQFEGDIRPEEVVAHRIAGGDGGKDSLLLAIHESGDSVLIDSYFGDDPEHSSCAVQNVRFSSDGTTWDLAAILARAVTRTGPGKATLDSGAGADVRPANLASPPTLAAPGTASGESTRGAAVSNNLYLFGKGDGDLTFSLRDGGPENVNDTLQFKAGVVASEISVALLIDPEIEGGAALRITLADTSDQVTITGFSADAAASGTSTLSRIVFDDGTAWDGQAIRDRLLGAQSSTARGADAALAPLAVSGAGIDDGGSADGNAPFEPSADLLPDLAAVALSFAPQVRAGTNLYVRWTERNLGTAPVPTGWTDRLVLSADGIIGNADDIFLADVAPNYAPQMAVGSTYYVYSNVTIPTGLVGTYQLGLTADIFSVVVGDITRSNNTVIQPVSILNTAAPPWYSDLLPTITSVPSVVPVGGVAQVQWSVKNIGVSATSDDVWYDTIYSSPTPSIRSSWTQYFSYGHTGTLAPGASYTASASISLPASVTGPTYFIVSTDAGAVFNELSFQSNNNATAATSTFVGDATPQANLTVDNLVAPAQWRVGDSVAVSYRVNNVGTAAVSATLQEEVRLVDPTGVNASVVLANTSTSTSRTLAIGGSYSQSLTFTVPTLPPGQWRLEVAADRTGVVPESSETDNVASTLLSVVASATSVDLVASSIEVPATAQAGTAISVRINVRNNGPLTATGAWIDRIVLSSDDVIGNADDILLTDVASGSFFTSGIPSGSSYGVIPTITLPAGKLGNYRIGLITDATSVFSDPVRSNNTALASITLVSTPASADLTPTLTSVPTVVTVGATAHIGWSVTNIGNVAISAINGWSDQVFLSPTPTLTSSSVSVGATSRTGTVAAGETYQAALDFTVPATLLGPMYVIVKVDRFGFLSEVGHTANNVVAAATPTQVVGTASPNLTVDNVVTPAQWRVGDTVNVSYRVNNTGSGAIDAVLQDQIRLVDPTGVNATRIVASLSGLRQIPAGGSYNINLSLVASTLPPGNWRLEVVADAGNAVAESSETDNIGSSLIAIVAPDLTVRNVRIVESAPFAGDTVTLQWKTSTRAAPRRPGHSSITSCPPAQRRWHARRRRVRQRRLVHRDGRHAGRRRRGAAAFRHGHAARGCERRRHIRRDDHRRQQRRRRRHRDRDQRRRNRGDEQHRHWRIRRRRAQLSEPGRDPGQRADSGDSGGLFALRWSVTNSGTVAATGSWTDRLVLSTDGTLSADDIILVNTVHSGGLAQGRATRTASPSACLRISTAPSASSSRPTSRRRWSSPTPVPTTSPSRHRLRIDPTYVNLTASNLAIAPVADWKGRRHGHRQLADRQLRDDGRGRQAGPNASKC
jgi:hypothetical protein